MTAAPFAAACSIRVTIHGGDQPSDASEPSATSARRIHGSP